MSYKNNGAQLTFALSSGLSRLIDKLSLISNKKTCWSDEQKMINLQRKENDHKKRGGHVWNSGRAA